MVANMGVFQFAEEPTNWYEYSIPQICLLKLYPKLITFFRPSLTIEFQTFFQMFRPEPGLFCFRIFEDVKEELMNIYQEREALEYRSENDNYEKVNN